MDLDEELAKRDERIAQLEKEVALAEKDKEIEKLEAIKAKDVQIAKLEQKLKQTKTVPTKTKTSKPLFQFTPRLRKLTASSLAVMVLVAGFIFFVPSVLAADPAINYADPDNLGRFADTNDGDGVQWTVNVTDADGDLAWVKLYSNSTGTWELFYDSGALGGVSYHNASGQNGNWTGSWILYYYNISADDGTTHDTTYSFTTGYQWGSPVMAYLADEDLCKNAVLLKNATSDHYLFSELVDGDVDVKTSDTCTNWSLRPKSADVASGEYLSASFTYNNQPSCLYQLTYLRRGYLDGASWTEVSTGIRQKGVTYYSSGADVIYYNGKWNIVAAIGDEEGSHICQWTGTFPSSWTKVATLHTGHQCGGGYPRETFHYPTLAVLNGTLHCMYKDNGFDLHWQTYDGASWTDKGTIGGDSLNLGGYTACDYSDCHGGNYYQACIVTDQINQQVVVVYINNDGDLVYRVTDNTTSWSDSHLILSEGSYDIGFPHIEFIDSRLMITISYNARGNYNIYTISSPGYTGISGSNYNSALNRIQWDDASPSDTNVNSSVFSLKNLDNRDIATIQWHFEDIGEITADSNIAVWTNMSGSWANIGATDASGNVSVLDISGLMAGGGEWIPGQRTYWMVEILDVGSVSEDIHSTDEDFYYKITFA